MSRPDPLRGLPSQPATVRAPPLARSGEPSKGEARVDALAPVDVSAPVDAAAPAEPSSPLRLRPPASGLAPLEALATALQPLLEATEGAGYGDFVDTALHNLKALGLAERERLRPADVRSAAYRAAAAVRDTMVGIAAGRLPEPDAPRDVLRLALERLEAGAIDLEAAGRALDADPRWAAMALRGPEGRLTLDSSWVPTQMTAAHALFPDAGAAELLGLREPRRLLELAARAAEGALSREALGILAAAELAGPGGDLAAMGGAVLPALVEAAGVSPVARLVVVTPENREAVEAELDAGTLDGRVEAGEQTIAFRAKRPAEVVQEVEARRDIGLLGHLGPEAEAALETLLAPDLAARLDDEASDRALRELSGEAVKMAALGLASFGVGAAAEAGMAAALLRGALAGPRLARVASATRFLATSLSFTTLASAADGRWSAARYGTDLVLFKLLGLAGRGAALFAGVVPAEARLARFALAQGLAVGSAAGVLTGVEAWDRASLGVDGRLRLDALARSYAENLGLVTVLHAVHVGLGALRPALAPGGPTALARHAALEARERQLAAELGILFETQVEVARDGRLTAAEGLDAEITARGAAVGALLADVERLTAEAPPPIRERVTRGLGEAVRTWRFVDTPGKQPRAEVEAAREAATRGVLGAAVAPEEGLLQRVQAGWKTRPGQATWARTMAEATRELSTELRAGRVTTLDAALEWGSSIARRAAKAAGRRDLGKGQTLDAFGRPRPLDELMYTPSPPYPGYHEALVRFTERPGEGLRELSQEGLPLTAGFAAQELGMWYHTGPELRSQVLAAAEGAWRRALTAERPAELVDATAEVHWWLAQLAPYARGSAGVADVIARGLLLAGGRGAGPIRAGAWREGVGPDLEAFHTPLGDFVRRYPSYFDPRPPAPVLDPAGE